MIPESIWISWISPAIYLDHHPQSCRRATVHKPSSACKGAQQNDEDQNKKQAFWFLWDEIGVVDLIDVTLAFQNLA